jgi:hypothetical protein
MAVTAANAVEYVMWLTWSCLTLTPANLKIPVFAMIYSTEDVLEQLMSDSLLVFAPGLLDVLQATTPPSGPTSRAYRQISKSIGLFTFLYSRNQAVGIKFTSALVRIGIVVELNGSGNMILKEVYLDMLSAL